MISERIESSQFDFIGVLRESWLRGENANEEKIGDYSRTSKYKVSGDEYYYLFKNKLNSAPGLGNVDLILTGSLIGQTKLFKKSNGIYEVMSSDRKVDDIIKRYGKRIFNYSDEIKKKYLDEILIFALETMLKKTYE